MKISKLDRKLVIGLAKTRWVKRRKTYNNY